MMKWVFSALVVAAVIIGFARGDAATVSAAAISSCADAVTLIITLCGIICLWSGIMRVAQSSGLTDLLARALSPVLRRLFRGISPRGEAMQFIVLNLTANLLGLGNASTPFGIAAMQAIEREERANESATDNMILLVVLNTASLQIIPTTVAALRMKNGSAAPMEIMPAVWAVSLACVVITVLSAKMMAKISRGRSGK